MKVDEIVSQVAKAGVSQDLLNKAGMPDLLAELFQSDLAEQPETLSHLMVIAIAQSQLLTRQQQTLQEQHSIIQKQSHDIERSNTVVSKHQKALSQHQTQLKKLIEGYAEFKELKLADTEPQGLSQESDDRIQSIEQALQNVITEQSEAIAGLQQFQSNEIQHLDDTVNEKIDFVEESLQASIDEQELALSGFQAYQENELRNLRDDLDFVKNELSDEIVEAKDLTESLANQNSEDMQFFENTLEENMTFLDDKLDAVHTACDTRLNKLSDDMQSELAQQNEALQNINSALSKELESLAEQLTAVKEEQAQSALKKDDDLGDKVDAVLEEGKASVEAQNQNIQTLKEQLESLETKSQSQNGEQKKHLLRVEQSLKKSVSNIGSTLSTHANFSKQLKATSHKELKALKLKVDQQEGDLSDALENVERRVQHLTLLAYGGIGVAVLTLIALVWMSLSSFGV